MVVFLSDFSAILLKTTNNLDDDLASDFCSDCSNEVSGGANEALMDAGGFLAADWKRVQVFPKVLNYSFNSERG